MMNIYIGGIPHPLTVKSWSVHFYEGPPINLHFPLSVGQGYPKYIHISGYLFQYEISIDMLAQICFGPWVSCPIPGEHAREAGFVDHVPSIKVQGSVILIHLDMERWGLMMDENRKPVWYLLYIQTAQRRYDSITINWCKSSSIYQPQLSISPHKHIQTPAS